MHIDRQTDRQLDVSIDARVCLDSDTNGGGVSRVTKQRVSDRHAKQAKPGRRAMSGTRDEPLWGR